jgi:NhaC family Na+:H+ antiporter
MFSYFSLSIFIISIILALINNVGIIYPIGFNAIFQVIFYFSKNKFNTIEFLKDIWEAIFSVRKVLILLVLITALIVLWYIGGVMPSLIYYIFSIDIPFGIVSLAFISSVIISMILGSAIGTVTITGPIFISISTISGIPLELTAGALVSGAYFGDRTSPFSSNAILCSQVTKTDLFSNIKLMLKSSIIPFIISLVIFSLSSNIAYTKDTTLLGLLYNNFDISLINLLPVVLMLLMIIKTRNSNLSIGSSILLTLIMIIINNDFEFFDMFNKLLNGYSTQVIELERLAKTKGILNILSIEMIIITSTFLNIYFNKNNVINPLLEKLVKDKDNFYSLSIKSSLIGTAISIITCSQALSSIITGRIMNDVYDKKGYKRDYLAQTLGDTSLSIVGLIPWNVNGLMMSSIIGVSTVNYFSYSYFLIILYILSTFVYPFLNKRNKFI